MSQPRNTSAGRSESPDPASHTANIYDVEASPDNEEYAGDDDDIDFRPTETESDDLEYFETGDDDEDEEDEEGSDGEYHDADEGLNGMQIEVSIDQSTENPVQGSIGTVRVTQAAGATGPMNVTRTQILQLLGQAGLRRILAQHGSGGLISIGGDEDDDDEEDEDRLAYGSTRRRRRRPKGSSAQLPPVPNPEGQKLMDSGTFGSNEHYQDLLRQRKQKVARRLMNRELGTDLRQTQRGDRSIVQGMIPSSKADAIIHYNSRCYSGQFSDDGNFFFSCAQDFKVRMYDTSNQFDWKYYKTVVYPFGQWTITDATLSPDNKYLAYSSIRSSVCLAATDPGDNIEPFMLDFADTGSRTRSGRRHGGNTHFGIWSVRFSGDGQELVAGTSDSSVYVFDIEANQSILKIPGHTEDVNAVCFGDKTSPHILYSGSDDTLIKVWDRRSMGDSREAGVFMGHTEGLTYVDSKGDGRYVLSNGKDQTMKLWDLRKMMSTAESSKLNPQHYTTGFDYRFMGFSDSDYTPHPHDCSLVTFRGHSVLKTLIRCHFSPPGSTNSRYVYSGSEDGKVYIYNLDATLAGTIDVTAATDKSRPKDPNLYAAYEMDDRNHWKTCVRDASWHPNVPMIAATSWNGWGMSTGTCTIHSWNDGADDDESDMKMGRRVDHKLEQDPAFYNTRTRIGSRSTLSRLRRLVGGEDDDDDEDDNDNDII